MQNKLIASTNKSFKTQFEEIINKYRLMYQSQNVIDRLHKLK